MSVQGLGIAGAVVLFALVAGVHHRRPSGMGPSGDDLVLLRRVELRSTFFSPSLGGFPYPAYLAFRQHRGTFADIAASMGGMPTSVRVSEGLEVVDAGLSSSNYLRVLGVRPVVGRGFTAEEERPGAGAVCLLNERLVRLWGLQGKVPGAVLVANGRSVTIVGVLPEAFVGINYLDRAEVMLPLSQHDVLFPDGKILDGGRASPFQLVARLKPGLRSRTAEAEARLVLRQQEVSDREKEPSTVVVEPVLAYSYIERWQLVPTYAALSLAATLFLAMTIFNVAGLGMALAVRRQREVAIRSSIGATPGRILFERLSEGLGIGLLAGGLGLVVAMGFLRILHSEATGPSVRRLVESASILNSQMPGFVLAASLLTTLASGFLPAWSAARTAPLLVLQGGDWTRRGTFRVRTVCLVGQTAIVTLLALIGAASIRSFWKALTVSPGFDTRGLSLARVGPVVPGYNGPKTAALARHLLGHLNVAPQSQTTTLSRLYPVNPSSVSIPMAIVDSEGPGITRLGSIPRDEVAPNYFEVLRIPIERGRSFGESDIGASTPVVIVNRFAALHWPWPQGEPIGSLVRLGAESTPRTVVGVVGNVNYRGVLSAPGPFAYVPLLQTTGGSIFDQLGLTITQRNQGTLAPRAFSLELAVHAFDSTLPVEAPRPIAAVLTDTLRLERMLGSLHSLFASLGLLVCAVGLYATVSQTIAEREKELGVRMALGARTGDVALLVARWWLISVGVGMAIGLGSGALLVATVSRTLAVLTIDALVVGSVSMIVLTVSLAAVSIPARRAVLADPAATLRLPSESQ